MKINRMQGLLYQRMPKWTQSEIKGLCNTIIRYLNIQHDLRQSKTPLKKLITQKNYSQTARNI